MDRNEMLQYIINEFDKGKLHISITQAEQFLRYYELLIEWNEKINLTTITDFNQVVLKHFIDSCSILTLRNVSRETIRGKLIDVGTGAGFPGIPLKIVNPSLKVTLLDSLNKRIEFLKVVCEELKLKEVIFIHMRAEDAASDKLYREKYDVCVSRAVANLSTLSEYCIPFVRKAGYFLSYKAGDINSEILEAKKAISVMGGELKSVEQFSLPASDIARSIIAIRKIESTPKKYPRKAGLPSKHPIN